MIWTSVPEAGTFTWGRTGFRFNGYIYISDDYGDKWVYFSKSPTGNFKSVSVSASGQYQTAVNAIGKYWYLIIMELKTVGQ